MKHWNKVSEIKPSWETDVEVMDRKGNKAIASLIYLDDIDKYVWKRDDMLLFSDDYYIFWKKIKYKRLILIKMMEKLKQSGTTLIDKIKNLFGIKRKYWIVTCFTEENEITSQFMFDSYEEAYSAMLNKYNHLVTALKDAVKEKYLFAESAEIIYDDDPCMFEFKITCIIK